MAAADPTHKNNIMDDPNEDDASQYFIRGDVHRVIVSGAEEEAVNGEYVKDAAASTPTFVMSGSWNGRQQDFYICKRGQLYWSIMFRDIALYKCKCQSGGDNKNKNNPPESGWYSSAPSNQNTQDFTPPTISLKFNYSLATTDSFPKVTTAMYKRLLFSDSFSDVKLVCDDGEVISAHKNILAESSPYFMAAFGGSWKEQETGELKVAYPAHVIKEFLALLYTGHPQVMDNSAVIANEALVFIRLSDEFGIDWLKTLAEPFCIRDLDASKLKHVWQVGRKFDNSVLKQACVDYARAHALALLVNHDFLQLKEEDSDSWNDFVEAVAPPE